MSASSVNTPTQEAMPISQLLRELLSKAGELITAQIALSKAELKAEGQKWGMAVGLGLLAFLVVFVTLLLASLTGLLFFSQWLDAFWAALATTGLFAFTAALLLLGLQWELRRSREQMQVKQSGE